MIFNSYIFLIAFLPVALIGFWLLRGRSARLLWLVALGLAFYGYWNWRFIPLLLGSAIATLTIGILINRSVGIGRRLVLAFGIIFHLALLGYFKYAGFFLETIGSARMISIIVPLGISFSAFQAISYLMDVYRKTIPAERNLLRFLCYSTLFPNIASGPILRYREIKPDLENIGNPAVPSAIHQGLMLIVLGLAKKVLIADQISEIIDPLWSSPETLSAAGAWLATLGYGLQLYFDFSGYSDMAIGIGALFGLTIPQNFNSPYKAVSPSDFWRRWHMTLGTWVKDYLYIPLGGSRRGTAKTMINLFIIMSLIGLWHGANWTFVVWGAYHGALLALYHLFRKWYDMIPVFTRRTITFLLITIGWIPFRSSDLATAKLLLTKMGNAWGSIPASTWSIILIIIALGITQFLPNTFEIRYPKTKRAAFMAALLLSVSLIFMNYKQATFLYYQF